MNSDLPRVLMLILASDTSPIYIKFQNSWRKIMNLHPNIDCFFYKGNPNQEDNYMLIDKNTLSIKIDDGYPMIYEKMRKVFGYFEDQLDSYDFVYRTNLSSFIVFENYLKTLSRIQRKTKFCSAIVGDYNGLHYPSGSGFTLSTDIVRHIIHNPIPRFIEDDVTVGVILNELGVGIIPVKRIDILSEQNAALIDIIDTNATDIFHYRLKSNSGDRGKDLEYFNRLSDKYYQKIEAV